MASLGRGLLLVLLLLCLFLFLDRTLLWQNLRQFQFQVELLLLLLLLTHFARSSFESFTRRVEAFALACFGFTVNGEKDKGEEIGVN